MAKTKMEHLPYYYQYRWMRQACQCPAHPDYDKYGAQGITCYWGPRTYHEFYAWLIKTLGERPSLDHILGRKDKSGNYEPGNLEWQTVQKRCDNKLRQNVYVTYRRKTKSKAHWARDLGIAYHTFIRRSNQGWSIKDIVKEYT